MLKKLFRFGDEWNVLWLFNSFNFLPFLKTQTDV